MFPYKDTADKKKWCSNTRLLSDVNADTTDGESSMSRLVERDIRIMYLRLLYTKSTPIYTRSLISQMRGFSFPLLTLH